MKTEKMTYMKDGAISSYIRLNEIVAGNYDKTLSHETYIDLLRNSVMESRTVEKRRLELSFDYFDRCKFSLGNGSDVAVGGTYFDVKNGEVSCSELLKYVIGNEWRFKKSFVIRNKIRRMIESIVV